MYLQDGLLHLVRRSMSHAALTLLLPVLVAYWALAHAAAWALTLALLPSLLLAQRL